MCGRVITSVKLCWRLISRCIQATSLQHSRSPAEPASWLPSSLIPGRPAGFFCGVAARPTSTSGLFSASRLLNSPERTVRLTGVPACQTPHIRGHQLQLRSGSRWTSNRASASHPMRQTAEKEGETNQLRSGCTLHRRREWWHDFGVWRNVFTQGDEHSGQMMRISVSTRGSSRS